MRELEGKRAVLLVEQLYNEQEFWYPKIRLQEAGAVVMVAGTEGKKEYPSKVGLPAKSDVAFADLKAADFDAVIIPGGFAPDFMRRSPDCVKFVREMFSQGKLVAFICHAGWVPISAGILKGKKATSFTAIKDDLVNAGVVWQDAAVVEDGNLISSRTPLDLPDFMRAVIAYLKK